VEEEDEVEDEHQVVRGPEVLHASAYVSICQQKNKKIKSREHEVVRGPKVLHASAYVSICQHMSAYYLEALGLAEVGHRKTDNHCKHHLNKHACDAYVSIRQHTSA
jgi:hypothetical protein